MLLGAQPSSPGLPLTSLSHSKALGSTLCGPGCSTLPAPLPTPLSIGYVALQESLLEVSGTGLGSPSPEQREEERVLP